MEFTFFSTMWHLYAQFWKKKKKKNLSVYLFFHWFKFWMIFLILFPLILILLVYFFRSIKLIFLFNSLIKWKNKGFIFIYFFILMCLFPNIKVVLNNYRQKILHVFSSSQCSLQSFPSSKNSCFFYLLFLRFTYFLWRIWYFQLIQLLQISCHFLRVQFLYNW